jgi:hypothetical protein
VLRQLVLLLLGLLQSAISSAADNQRPKVFVSSSAVGYYGASSTSSFTEDSPAGSDYLAEICKGEPGCCSWWCSGVFSLLEESGVKCLACPAGAAGMLRAADEQRPCPMLRFVCPATAL